MYNKKWQILAYHNETIRFDIRDSNAFAIIKIIRERNTLQLKLDQIKDDPGYVSEILDDDNFKTRTIGKLQEIYDKKEYIEGEIGRENVFSNGNERLKSKNEISDNYCKLIDLEMELLVPNIHILKDSEFEKIRTILYLYKIMKGLISNTSAYVRKFAPKIEIEIDHSKPMFEKIKKVHNPQFLIK